MNKKSKSLLFLLVVLDLVLLAIPFTLIVMPSISPVNIAVLNPKGVIAFQERRLLVTAVLIMLIVVIPVYVLTFFFAWKYRATNKSEQSAPDTGNSLKTELLLWGIPAVIILVLAVINWKSTHELDPLKPINSKLKPITIQVVALEWKWLFIYPEANIATVNFIQFPEDTPLNFQLTADAPMNSFWIPQLGGQMYAMAGMTTKLHLMADEIGEFAGSAAEINGKGFSGMKFIAKSTSQADFDAWVASVKQSSAALTQNEYNKLAEPSENNPVEHYGTVEAGLLDNVIMKYTLPSKNQ